MIDDCCGMQDGSTSIRKIREHLLKSCLCLFVVYIKATVDFGCSGSAGKTKNIAAGSSGFYFLGMN